MQAYKVSTGRVNWAFSVFAQKVEHICSQSMTRSQEKLSGWTPTWEWKEEAAISRDRVLQALYNEDPDLAPVLELIYKRQMGFCDWGQISLLATAVL